MSDKRTTQDWDLPGEYGEIMEKVESGLQCLQERGVAGEEIERKFLIDNYPFGSADTVFIEQVYLGDPTEKLEARIRRRGPEKLRTFGDFELTIKMGAPPARIERTVEVSSELFLTAARQNELQVVKRRVCTELPGGRVAEVDFFEDPDLEEVLVEVEFETRQEAENFDPEELSGAGLRVLEEVTGQDRWLNRNIAKRKPNHHVGDGSPHDYK